MDKKDRLIIEHINKALCRNREAYRAQQLRRAIFIAACVALSLGLFILKGWLMICKR